MNQLIRPKTALLSVSDKTHIEALARGLQQYDIQLISTGGTKDTLVRAGLRVRDIQTVTGNPEAFQGRMKTISFQVASGILFDRNRDKAEAEQLGIAPIDLVVCNLYPFAENKDRELGLDKLIEYIDIGGPTMIRAAAKNFEHVVVLTSPEQYQELLTELAAHDGSVSLTARKRWMAAAFAATAAYDATISAHLGGHALRYGENPHQSARFVANSEAGSFEILGGKELSYNNLVDLDAAIDAVAPRARAACAIVKHENPCGLAEADTGIGLLQAAWAGDPVSAFGSVIALNWAPTKADLEFLELDLPTRKFIEVIAAPGFDVEALAYLRLSKNLRIIQAPRALRPTRPASERWRQLRVGTLIQSADTQLSDGYRTVSEAQPHAFQEALADFGMHAVRCIKSNAIAIVRAEADTYTLLGMGAGQPNRVKSTELAIAQALANLHAEAALRNEHDADGYAREQLARCYLTSDAFFPFRDAVDTALTAGIRHVIQPGGSIRDAEVTAACNERGAVLTLSGLRHFKH
jgi:phosphoribosylaminoimidazolecarboxamide formyltransferase / IMP cyclohydrolase